MLNWGKLTSDKTVEYDVFTDTVVFLVARKGSPDRLCFARVERRSASCFAVAILNDQMVSVREWMFKGIKHLDCSLEEHGYIR